MADGTAEKDGCQAGTEEGETDNSAINGNRNNQSDETNTDSNQGPPIVMQSSQDVRTREKLFDFIALLQGRRMDDQRAILKPSSTT